MPIIPATQEANIRRMTIQSQPRQTVGKTLFLKNPSQKGLVEWLKVKVLGSSPSTANKKKKLMNTECLCEVFHNVELSSFKKKKKKVIGGPNMLLYSYNPSYTRGKQKWEDQGLRTAQAKI
jgi:hypothetical protein